MPQTASGSFNVTLAPLDIEGELMGRRSIDKTFHGALEGVSTGQMLSAGTEALEGLTGSTTIAIDEGRHHYVLTYELPTRV